MPGPRTRWLHIVALVTGLTALVLGVLGGGLFILLSLAGRPGADALGVTTLGVSMAALGVGVGGAVAWAGYNGSRRRSSRPFQPRTRWFLICLAGLGLALPIGQVILSLDLLAPITFPLFHVLGVALPAMAIVVLIGGRIVGSSSPAPTQRQVVGQMALGALGATAISFALEAVAIVIGLVLVGVVMALTPGGLKQLTELQALVADPTRLQDLQTLARWLLNPVILLSVTVMLAIVVPLIEEGAKSIGVPLLALWIRGKPTPVQGWLSGIAVGTGFAIAEGLFNGAANLPFWAGIALLRVGATVMHAATAGFTGLGWTRTLASRRPWTFLGSYLASVTIHGLWNGATVLVVVSSLRTMSQPGEQGIAVVGGLGVVAGLSGLVLLLATISGVAVYVTLRVRRS